MSRRPVELFGGITQIIASVIQRLSFQRLILNRGQRRFVADASGEKSSFIEFKRLLSTGLFQESSTVL